MILLWPLLTGYSLLAQSKTTTPIDAKQLDNYKEQIRRLVGFFQLSLNTLGDPETSTRDKEKIINESYIKAFRETTWTLTGLQLPARMFRLI